MPFYATESVGQERVTMYILGNILIISFESALLDKKGCMSVEQTLPAKCARRTSLIFHTKQPWLIEH